MSSLVTLDPKLRLGMLSRSSASRVARRVRQAKPGRQACPSRAWVRAKVEVRAQKGACPVENKRHPCLMSHPWCLGGSLGVSGIKRLSESSLHSRTGHARWLPVWVSNSFCQARVPPANVKAVLLDHARRRNTGLANSRRQIGEKRPEFRHVVTQCFKPRGRIPNLHADRRPDNHDLLIDGHIKELAEALRD